jgi:hypothetical protein
MQDRGPRTQAGADTPAPRQPVRGNDGASASAGSPPGHREAVPPEAGAAPGPGVPPATGPAPGSPPGGPAPGYPPGYPPGYGWGPQPGYYYGYGPGGYYGAPTPGDYWQSQIASGLNFLAGLWVIVSPWVFGYFSNTAAMWNDVGVGIAVSILALIRVFDTRGTAWLSWINVILGGWFFFSPWIFGYTANTAGFWNSIATGAAIFLLGLWSSSQSWTSYQYYRRTYVP